MGPENTYAIFKQVGSYRLGVWEVWPLMKGDGANESDEIQNSNSHKDG